MKTIVIADDEENIRTFLEVVLKNKGYRVVAAANGREAVEKVREESPDLLIMDIRMPDMTGLEALETVRKENKSLPIIISSGLEKLEDDFTITSSNISAFLTKPIEARTLTEKVKEILGD